MPKCYHCGEDEIGAYLCSECGQYFCSLHIDQITHECNLVKEESLIMESFQTPSNFQSQTNYLSEKETTNRSQCWFCGSLFTDVYFCEKCNCSFCLDHKNLESHDCPSLFKDKEPEKQIIMEKPDLSDSSIEDLPQGLGIEKMGKLELDSNIVDNTVNNLIQSYINNVEDPKFRKIIINNPTGEELIQTLINFFHHPLIYPLCLWLSGMESISLEALQQFELDDELLGEDTSLHHLIKEHNKNLYDASYLDFIAGEDQLTNEIIEEKVIVKGNIKISKLALTYISEHSRKSGERECSGFLLGKRNQDGSIKEITGCISEGLGVSTMVMSNPRNLLKPMIELKDSDREIVGWYHSHPKDGVPIFSQPDKSSHLLYGTVISFIYHLKGLEGQISKRTIKIVFNFISEYIDHCWRKLGITPENMATSLSVSNAIEFSRLIMDLYPLLKAKLKNINVKSNIDESHLQLIPIAGIVVCTSRRYISVIDCTLENDVYNWYYYRIT